MTYKKVTSIFKGTLKIRSEPDADSRLCGSIQYGESLIVETTKVKSKQGKDYYKLAGYGYVIASQMKDAESQTEMDEKVNTAVKKAESAAKACDGIASGMNVMIDSATGKACKLGMTDGNIVVREA